MSQEERIRSLEERVESAHQVLPDLVDSVRALTSQAGVQTAEAVAVRRDLDRLAKAIDGPPHIDVLRSEAARVEAPAPKGGVQGILSSSLPLAEAFNKMNRGTQVVLLVALVVVMLALFGDGCIGAVVPGLQKTPGPTP